MAEAATLRLTKNEVYWRKPDRVIRCWGAMRERRQQLLPRVELAATILTSDACCKAR